MVDDFAMITKCSCDTMAVDYRNGSGRGPGMSLKFMSPVIWKGLIGCIHAIQRLVADFRLTLKARVVFSSETLTNKTQRIERF